MAATNIIDLTNAIRTDAGEEYQNDIPEATRENIAAVGNALLAYEPDKETFLNVLINKIALTIVNQKMYTNKLGIFNRGEIATGNAVEELYIGLIKGAGFDFSAENDPFVKNIPEVRTLYHKIDRDLQYVITVSDSQLKTAFTNVQSLQSFVQSLISTAYNSKAYDEYVMTKELLTDYIDRADAYEILSVEPRDFATAFAEYYTKSGETYTALSAAATFAKDTYYRKMSTPVIEVTKITDEATARLFMNELKKASDNMTFMSKAYNRSGVLTFTEKPAQVLLINKDVKNALEAVQADMFDISKAMPDVDVIVLDDFGSSVKGTYAMLIDKDAFRIYTTLATTEQIRNPHGRYTNYFINNQGIMSFSYFDNAVVFNPKA